MDKKQKKSDTKLLKELNDSFKLLNEIGFQKRSIKHESALDSILTAIQSIANRCCDKPESKIIRRIRARKGLDRKNAD